MRTNWRKYRTPWTSDFRLLLFALRLGLTIGAFTEVVARMLTDVGTAILFM